MSTTPLWVPLFVAAIGVVGAVLGSLGGVLITQRRSDRREELTWQRERERERERWSREDIARIFEHRREAYADFYASLRAMARRAYDHGLGFGLGDAPDELPDGWQTESFLRLQRLDLIASESVRRTAGTAYGAVWQWGHEARRGNDDGAFYDAQDRADYAEAEMLEAMRADLAIPPAPAPASVAPPDLRS